MKRSEFFEEVKMIMSDNGFDLGLLDNEDNRNLLIKSWEIGDNPEDAVADVFDL